MDALVYAIIMIAFNDKRMELAGVKPDDSLVVIFKKVYALGDSETALEFSNFYEEKFLNAVYINQVLRTSCRGYETSLEFNQTII